MCHEAKRCILTIAHPNGGVRTYSSPETFPRKNEAKSQTAALAVETGALEFIKSGEGEGLKAKPGVVLALLDAHTEDAALPEPQEDSLILEIEDACARWWGGRARPYWAAFSDPKAGTSACISILGLSSVSLAW